MNNTINVKLNQAKINKNNVKAGILAIPSFLTGFINTDTEYINEKNKMLYIFKGKLIISDEDYICPNCNNKMHINNHYYMTLKHITMGNCYSKVLVEYAQFYCPYCGLSKMQDIKFKCKNHQITNQLYQYVYDLLEMGTLTNKDISIITGVNKNLVKEIDKERLQSKYTTNGKLIPPLEQASYLGVDEFKLHNGHKYATIIINLETGHVLWVARGKKKQVIYDFMEYVGNKWMMNVKAVACDMNASYESAFLDKYPHIKIVFDHFHIVKNFNEFVVSPIYKEEQTKLRREGKVKEANSLKNSKYILFSSKETLRKKDEINNKYIQKDGIFKIENNNKNIINYQKRYDEIVKDNEIFITIDLIKETLKSAYNDTDVESMHNKIASIVDLCRENGHKKLIWFSNLITNHYEGIINHAIYNISTGKVEGINNKIKTLRRQHYGIPDDEYFFLKIIDVSYTK